MSNSLPRIVITGMGAISPVGLNNRETFDQLVAGRSGVGPITQFDASRLPSRIAGEVKNFNPTDHMDHKAARRIGRYAHFSIAASTEAIRDAGLNLQQTEPSRIATLVASATADFSFIESQMFHLFQNGPGKTNPFAVPRASTSMAAGNVALHFGLTGPGFGVSSACATGSHALATAWMLLRAGFADVALAGGAESAITESYLESFCALRALSTRNDEPEKASRPFDRTRDGFVMAEGAAVLVLETLEHARQRSARIWAELAGIGMSCDAHHITAAHPDGRGASQAMDQALKSAGLDASQIDYINAHGTSTDVNDPIETRAIKTTFGQRAYTTPISSIKSMIGHSIGASGALEAVTCVNVINRGVIPPTINLEQPDPACDLDYVPNQARVQPVRTAMSNSFAFGGQNCVLIFKRFEDQPR
ncbi:MAG TPA: beta-ketoacyl-ACP synthase II [Verrucomicrobiota bacterium]|nr:beta-ketoacyl-[acyl-carrier-protein] synthase II [Verrucomicrobiales bacterium]HRI13165.1 beta-ketoacyl-ACP synthase II [Verrucomicrobiota bacterium]